MKKNLIESLQNPIDSTQEQASSIPVDSSPRKRTKSPKKTQKMKENLIESLQNPVDSTQEQASLIPVASSPRKRTKSPGVRLVGSRIYDSENGKTCHQCRQKTMDFVAACKGLGKRDQPCTIKFCHKCLLNRYGEKAEEVDTLDDWKCPKCREICNCSFCMKKRGHQPTGILVHTAKATGFRSVSEMLIVNGPEKSSLASKKEIASDGKDDPKAPTLPGEGKKMKKLKRKKSENSKTDDHIVEGNNDDGNQLVETHLSGETTRNGEEVVNETVAVVGNKLKKKQKKVKKLEESTSNDETHDGNEGEGSQLGKKDVKAKIKKNDNVDIKKPKKSQVRKKTPLDPLKTDENAGNNGLEDKPKPPANSGPKTKPEAKPVTSSKLKVDADAVLPLPQGIDLKTVADIELSALDVGPALQFLEFCNAFGEILQLKKDEPKSILKELTSERTLRRRQHSSLVQFHIQLLSMIQKDMDEDPISNGSSWFQELGECISKSRYASIEFPPEWFNRGNGGYEDLDSSKRLKLLNFLCDEALCTADSRAWIEKQNEKMLQKGKEAKEKVIAAKEKEKHLKQQMQDEVAKAVLEKNGAPLSISEHEDLVSKIKTDVAKAHAERLEALGMVPKRKQRSDAVRTEPVLLNEDGLILWKLQSCSYEPNILLQDIRNRDSDKAEDKWFTYDVEQKEAVEKYISLQRTKRLRSQAKMPTDTCIDKENIQED
ncbi:hypothetical protein ACHQM5_005779 [Ranunculus cassubicifolius]